MRVILFADNDEDFVEARSEFLEAEGYTVLKAYSPEGARDILSRKRVQLAILDIRLTDDTEGDISGVELALESAYDSLPKIMLTGFPDAETATRTLKHRVGRLPAAVDYISKHEKEGKPGAEVLIDTVERAFAQHVRINWDLEIHWARRERMSFFHLAGLLQPDMPNDILVERAGELEDLFRKLFYDCRQILIGRLFWHEDLRFCLLVLAQSAHEATNPRILVCGERGHLQQELDQMRELAPKTVQGTELMDKKPTETLHFGTATYVLPSSEIETVQPLRDLFKIGTLGTLRRALDHLLKEVLVAWHRHGQKTEKTRDLMSLYRQWAGLEQTGLDRREIESRVDALVQAVRPLSAVEVERGNGLVAFHFPNQVPLICPDPVATVYTPLESYDKPVVCRISPGQLTADNVLVDANQRTWLTDFAHAGQAPEWWDYVCLEAVIRFDLSQAPDLLAWQEFEECLVTPARLHDRLQEQDVVPDLRTCIVLIEQIRRQAGSETGPDPLPYYVGLLTWAVGEMARHDPTALYTRAERMRGAHLLLAAAMITHRLTEKFSASQPGGILRLDDDDTVWVGDHRVVDLGGQEFELLRCLHGREGQLVSRQAIVESVFGEQYRAGDKHLESRINSLVRRLRVKIEPNPSRPRYVLTVKGKGYRLQAEGKPHG